MVCIAVVFWQRTKPHCVRHCTTTETKVTQIKIPTACSTVETNSEYAHLAQLPPPWKMSVSCSDALHFKWISQPLQGRRGARKLCPVHPIILRPLWTLVRGPLCCSPSLGMSQSLSMSPASFLHAALMALAKVTGPLICVSFCAFHAQSKMFTKVQSGNEGEGSRRKEIQFCLETVSELN